MLKLSLALIELIEEKECVMIVKDFTAEEFHNLIEHPVYKKFRSSVVEEQTEQD